MSSSSSRARVVPRQGLFSLAACLVAVLGQGCAADYVQRTASVRKAYQSYRYDEAVAALDREFPAVKAGENDKDKLLVLFDRGMILHAAQKHQESIQVLAQADELSQQLDSISVSEEAATLVTNERHRAYRGEDFEKLMISTLQALNYAQQGKDEDALVEVRRVNERMLKMISDEKKPYEQLAIARYLGGVLYEDQGELDSAFIDYAQALKLGGELGALAEPAVRLARQTGRDDAYAELKARYPSLDKGPLGPDEGQVVVVVEAGLSPKKLSTDPRDYGGKLIPLPYYVDRGVPPRVEVRVGDGQRAPAVTVTSLRKVAKVHLEDRLGRMLARSLAGTAVKAGLAAGVGALTNSKELGFLTFLLLSASNQADLRSWLSLPAEFQVARFRLPKGRHQLQVAAGGWVTNHEVEVKPRRIALLVLRRY